MKTKVALLLLLCAAPLIAGNLVPQVVYPVPTFGGHLNDGTTNSVVAVKVLPGKNYTFLKGTNTLQLVNGSQVIKKAGLFTAKSQKIILSATQDGYGKPVDAVVQ